MVCRYWLLYRDCPASGLAWRRHLRPCSVAQTATCARELMPSLFRMWTTWLAAVPSVITSSSAIWRLVSPVRSARPPPARAGQHRGNCATGRIDTPGGGRVPVGDRQRLLHGLVELERAASSPGRGHAASPSARRAVVKRAVQPGLAAGRERRAGRFSQRLAAAARRSASDLCPWAVRESGKPLQDKATPPASPSSRWMAMLSLRVARAPA